MGKVIIHEQITGNGAFESPSPETWLELDTNSSDAALEQLTLADALLLGRKTYEGLAPVWPQLALRCPVAALPARRQLKHTHDERESHGPTRTSVRDRRRRA